MRGMRAGRVVMMMVVMVVAGMVWAQDGAGKKRMPEPPAGPVMFNTPEADAILSGAQVFPPNNPWNWDVSRCRVAANSGEMIAAMGPDGRLSWNYDMCFVIVPPGQKRVEVQITEYPGESDPGPYPAPEGMPIEGWPMSGDGLEERQAGGEGDRHGIVVDPWSGYLAEFWLARKVNGKWQASQASVFNLKSNELRPDGWTSADAAGLPIFPAVVKYHEVASGMVRHAMRVTVQRTRADWVYPARHKASRLTDGDLPRMGERLRLRADFDERGFGPHVQAILRGLKVHGMMVADNGKTWLISVTPDERIKGLEELTRVRGRDFEVVDTDGRMGE